jgi:hypothetical protein
MSSGIIKTVGIDFDGPIHRYSKGWQDGSIYDPPTERALEAIRDLSSRYQVDIFSSRADSQTKIAEMAAWLLDHDIHGWRSITNRKNPWEFMVDDRAFRWRNWFDTLAAIATARASGEIE